MKEISSKSYISYKYYKSHKSHKSHKCHKCHKCNKSHKCHKCHDHKCDKGYTYEKSHENNINEIKSYDKDGQDKIFDIYVDYINPHRLYSSSNTSSLESISTSLSSYQPYNKDKNDKYKDDKDKDIDKNDNDDKEYPNKNDSEYQSYISNLLLNPFITLKSSGRMLIIGKAKRKGNENNKLDDTKGDDISDSNDKRYTFEYAPSVILVNYENDVIDKFYWKGLLGTGGYGKIYIYENDKGYPLVIKVSQNRDDIYIMKHITYHKRDNNIIDSIPYMIAKEATFISSPSNNNDIGIWNRLDRKQMKNLGYSINEMMKIMKLNKIKYNEKNDKNNKDDKDDIDRQAKQYLSCYESKHIDCIILAMKYIIGKHERCNDKKVTLFCTKLYASTLDDLINQDEKTCHQLQIQWKKILYHLCLQIHFYYKHYQLLYTDVKLDNIFIDVINNNNNNNNLADNPNDNRIKIDLLLGDIASFATEYMRDEDNCTYTYFTPERILYDDDRIKKYRYEPIDICWLIGYMFVKLMKPYFINDDIDFIFNKMEIHKTRSSGIKHYYEQVRIILNKCVHRKELNFHREEAKLIRDLLTFDRKSRKTLCISIEHIMERIKTLIYTT